VLAISRITSLGDEQRSRHGKAAAARQGATGTVARSAAMRRFRCVCFAVVRAFCGAGAGHYL